MVYSYCKSTINNKTVIISALLFWLANCINIIEYNVQNDFAENKNDNLLIFAENKLGVMAAS